MTKKQRLGLVPLFATGLLGLTAAGCSSYGTGDYGYYGGSYLGSAYGAPYSYGRGANYPAPPTTITGVTPVAVPDIAGLSPYTAVSVISAAAVTEPGAVAWPAGRPRGFGPQEPLEQLTLRQAARPTAQTSQTRERGLGFARPPANHRTARQGSRDAGRDRRPHRVALPRGGRRVRHRDRPGNLRPTAGQSQGFASAVLAPLELAALPRRQRCAR